METDKKKKTVLPAAERHKRTRQLVKSSVESLTQLAKDVVGSSCFGRQIIQLKPPPVTQFAYAELLNIIRTRMPLTPDCTITQCDSFITTYPDDVFLNCMTYIMLRDSEEYAAEQFDCDDFSMVFAGLARRWHARMRLQLEGVASVKTLLPAAPQIAPGTRVIPRIPAAAASAAAAAAASATTTVAVVAVADDTKRLGGCPVGMCHGHLSADDSAHAFNFWISSKGEIVYIEPQTGEYITLGAGASINFVYI